MIRATIITLLIAASASAQSAAPLLSLMTADVGGEYNYEIAMDSGSNENHADITNGILTEAAGEWSAVFNADGKAITQSTGITGEDWSISWWMNRTAGGLYHFLSQYLGGDRMRIYGDHNDIRVQIGAGEDGFTGFSTLGGTWKHWVFTKSGTVGTLYTNGAFHSSATVVDLTPSAVGFCFGARNDYVVGSLVGSLDGVAAWNRVITSGEVSTLYSAGKDGAYNSISTTGQAFYFTMEPVTE